MSFRGHSYITYALRGGVFDLLDFVCGEGSQMNACVCTNIHIEVLFLIIKGTPNRLPAIGQLVRG